MSVTLTIDEALLHEAEQATNIHDWSALVKKDCKFSLSAPHAPKWRRLLLTLMPLSQLLPSCLTLAMRISCSLGRK
ncbi:MAG: hypothetical protein IPK32_20455 [Verrucomicrobiaceae bacterium]|nr:hypothetical protein [Verrucomicrobiaceae bacterium]